ncbi:hypothetical protein BH09ACT9_BH09ACT9_36780 [soil metagenome]
MRHAQRSIRSSTQSKGACRESGKLERCGIFPSCRTTLTCIDIGAARERAREHSVRRLRRNGELYAPGGPVRDRGPRTRPLRQPAGGRARTLDSSPRNYRTHFHDRRCTVSAVVGFERRRLCQHLRDHLLSQPCDRPRRDDAGDPPGWKHLCRNVVGERVGSSTPKGGRLCVEWHHTTTDDMVEPERIREGSSWIGVGQLGLAPARVATTSRFGSRRGTVRPGAGVEELSRGGSRRRELGFDVSAPPLDARTLSQVARGRPRRHQRIRPPHGHCPEL